jgi:PAS domain S-box-containing protein
MRKLSENLTDAENLHRKAEELLKKKQSEMSTSPSEPDKLKLFHELQVHQIELEMQNEELLQANAKIEELAADKYKELYDFAPTGYFTLSRKGEIIQLNLSGAAMLGKERSRLINKMFSFFVSAESSPIFSQFFNKLFDSKTKETCEIILPNTRNRPAYVHLSGIASENKAQFFITAVDISELKQAEAAQKQGEGEIRRQNELFDSLIKNLPMGVFMVEAPSGRPLVANQTALNLLGRGILPDATKHNLAEVYQAFKNDTDHPYPVDEMPVIKGMKGESSSIDDMIVIRPDGSKTHLEIFGSPVKDDKGNIWASLVSFSDITERKLSEAIFRDIIEKNPMSIQILNMEGYPVQINSAHTRLFGVQPPSDYSLLKDPQLLSQGFGELFEKIKKGEVVHFPDSYFNVHDVDPTFPDYPVWVKAVGFTLNDYNGIPEKIVIMHENVTERKHAEDLFYDIIEKNPMSIQIVDKEGHTLHGNPAYTHLFGAIPPPSFSIFDDLQNKSKELERLIMLAKGGGVVHLPDIYYNPHDEVAEAPDIPLWIRALIFPLNDSSGKPERFVFMHENITENKLAEFELIKAKERAEESDQLKSAFLANMSHEIRTPLNSIIGFSDLLIDPDFDEEQKFKFSKAIIENGDSLLLIINDILDLSMISAGQMRIIHSKFSVQKMLNDLMDEFNQRAIDKGIEYLLAVPSEYQEIIIEGDKQRTRQILINFISNAFKFTKRGLIELGIFLKEDSIVFHVKDTGIGIKTDNYDLIFDRFRQLENTTTKRFGGNGLGLAISKNLAELLGGNIWVESEVGKGSTFYLSLPIHKLH